MSLSFAFGYKVLHVKDAILGQSEPCGIYYFVYFSSER